MFDWKCKMCTFIFIAKYHIGTFKWYFITSNTNFEMGSSTFSWPYFTRQIWRILEMCNFHVKVNYIFHLFFFCLVLIYFSIVRKCYYYHYYCCYFISNCEILTFFFLYKYALFKYFLSTYLHIYVRLEQAHYINITILYN